MNFSLGTIFALFKAVDELTGPAAAMAASVDRATDSMGGSFDGLHVRMQNVNRLAGQFSGDKVVQSAEEYAAAVTKVGGAARLTEAEQARVNRAVSEAIEKYQVMGKTAPAHLVALRDATKQTDKTSLDWTSTLKSLSNVLAATFSVGAITSWITKAMDAGGRIDDLSKKMGVSIEAVQRWDYAATMGGRSIADVDRAVSFMNKTLAGGSNSTVSALSLAGLKFADIRAMAPEDAFESIAGAVAEIEDPMTRAYVAMALFGKTGQELLPAIQDGFVEVGRSASVMSDEAVRRLAEAGDEIDRWSNRISTLWGESLGRTSSAFNQVTHTLNVFKKLFTGDWDVEGGVAAAVERGAAAVPKLASSLDRLIPKLPAASKVLEEFDAANKKAEEASKKAAEEARRLAVAFQAQVDVLTGKNLGGRMAELSAQVAAAEKQGGLHAAQSAKVTKELIELRTLGVEPATEALRRLVSVEDEAVEASRFSQAAVQALFDVLKNPPAAGLQALQRDFYNMGMGLKQTLPGLKQTLEESAIALLSLPARNDEAWRNQRQFLPLDKIKTEIDLVTGKITSAGATSGRSFSDMFASALDGLGDVVIGAIQGGGDVGRAAGASLGQSIGKDLAANLLGESTSKLLKGALSFLGPLGAVAGGALGGLIGGLFGDSKGKKELLAANAEIEKYRQNLLKTYGSLQNIAKLDAALGTDLAAGWAHQGKVGLAAFTASAEELEARLASVRDEMSRVAADGGLASAELIRFRDAMTDDVDIQGFVLGQVQKAAEHVRTFVDNASILTQQGASAMASVVLAAWDGTASGLRDLLPTIQALQGRLEDAGFAGGSAFDRVTRLAGVAANEVTGPMLTAINSATGAMTAMYNAGFLTQDMFGGLVTEVMAQRDAMIAAGATANDVNAVMQADLQRIWELTQDGTYAIDEKTRALLDEAEAAGTVGDRFRTTEDRMLLALERLADMFETVFADKLTSAAQRGALAAESALNNIPTDFDVNVRTHVRGLPSQDRDEGEHGLPGYRFGTQGRYVDFGAGTQVVLHGRERVVTESEGRAEAAAGMDPSALAEELRQMRADFPRAVAIAVQEALLVSPRGGR